MGTIGLFVSFGFFSLLSIAALTSTISSIEVPVAYLIEEKSKSRINATWMVSLIVLSLSLLIIAFFDILFGFIIQMLTTILQPLSCLFYFIVVGWLWKRGNKLVDVREQKDSVWMKIWGNYLRYCCPVLLTIVFINVSILN